MSADAPPEQTETVTVTIDGTDLQVPKGTLVIRAAEQLGITIPRFCDHPLLDPVAACRQCLVVVEGQRKPMTACSTTCTEGMVVQTHITSEQAKRDQERMLELLLINHPLDCPQCDKGGECPLQDQALAHGNADSRFLDDKRRYDKAVPISAQVLLDRERCVLCARCTRFSNEISGDPFIELFERGALEQVAIYEDEPYDSYYSGNVVQICPVGALTADSYRFGARPFDLYSTDSVCNQCANGCNQRVDVRRGEIQRQLAQDNMAVNESWNCDKGRFAFEYVAAPDRLREPLVRDDLGQLQPTSWVGAVRTAARGFKKAIDAGGPGAVGVLTGGRLTDEDAYALSRFARDVLGTDNVDSRLRPRTAEERDVLAAIAGTVGPLYDDVEHAPVVVLAGLDTEEEAPILHLRLRKAARKQGQRLIVVGPVLGNLADVAWRWVPTPAGGEAEVIAALAQGTPPQVALRPRPDGADDADADEITAALGDVADGLVVVAGERLAQSPGALRAAADLAVTSGGRFAWVPRRTNSRGAVDAGLMPGLLPGGRHLDEPGAVGGAWDQLPEAEGLDTRGILEAAAEGTVTALYLVGVDPARDFEDPELAQRALQRVETLVVQDLLPTASTRHADVLLPAQSSQERVGSFTTWEGRRQAFRQALEPQGYAQQDWDIIRQVARALGRDLGWETATDVRREAAPLMEHDGPGLVDMPAASRTAGVPDDREPVGAHEVDVVVVPLLLGRGEMLTGAKALLETARPATAWLHPDDATAVGVHDGATVRVEGPQAALELPVRWTPHVRPGTVVLPENSTETSVMSLWSGAATGPRRVRLQPAVAAEED